MDMYINFTPISVNSLIEKGFVIVEHDYLSSLQYEGNEAIVLVEIFNDGNKYVTDISIEGGINNNIIIDKLKELYKLKLIDERSTEYQEWIHEEIQTDNLPF